LATSRLAVASAAPSKPAASPAAASSADPEAELAGARVEAALQGADHAGGDSGAVPVHPHHRAERLEPEGVGEAGEEGVAALMMDDRRGDDRAEPGHPLAEPGRHPAAVKRQVRAARPPSHGPGPRKFRTFVA
jgi:hypothetical protein